MKRVKYLFFLIAITLVGIQFFPASRNEQTTVPSETLSTSLAVPDNVHTLLVAACYDCHSNQTHYPWYTHLQPVDWYLNKHIREGKEELNFDRFFTYSDRKKRNKLRSIASQVEQAEMPLGSYKLLHPEARLSDKEKQLIVAWAVEQAGRY